MFSIQYLTPLQRLRQDAPAIRDLEPHLGHSAIPGLGDWDAAISRIQAAPAHQRAALAQRILDDLLRSRRLRNERHHSQPFLCPRLTSIDDGLDGFVRRVLAFAIGAFRWLADRHGWGSLPVQPTWCLFQAAEVIEPVEVWAFAEHVSDYARAAADDAERSYSQTFREGLVALADRLDSMNPNRAPEGEAWRPDPAEPMPIAVLQIMPEIAMEIGILLEMPGDRWTRVSLSEPAAIQDLDLEMPPQRNA